MANLGDSTTYGNHVITGNLSVSGKGSLPIGATYLQLPSQSAPDDIFTGTWSNISSSYAGDFFRAEGGRAAAFGSGQNDAMQRISGLLRAKAGADHGVFSSSSNGIFSDVIDYRSRATGDSVVRASHAGINVDSANSTSPSSAKTDDYETRPANRTVRIWKRIS